MNLIVHQLSRNDAESIVLWKYEGKYSIYNTDPSQYSLTTDYILDAKNGFFGVFRNHSSVCSCQRSR
jgi:hypothetical protein